MGISYERIEEICKSHVDPLLSRIEQLERDKMHLLEKVRFLERRQDDGDQYVMRQNLILDGVPMRKNQSPDDIRNLVIDEIERLDIDMDDMEVDRAHRIEEPYRDNKGYLHQPVIVRFISWGARNKMYQLRRRSKFRCRPHMTARRQDILESARQQISTLKLEDLISYVFIDKNCRLQAKCADGRVLGFSTADEFLSLSNYIQLTTGRHCKEEIDKMYAVTGCHADDHEPNAPFTMCRSYCASQCAAHDLPFTHKDLPARTNTSSPSAWQRPTSSRLSSPSALMNLHHQPARANSNTSISGRSASHRTSASSDISDLTNNEASPVKPPRLSAPAVPESSNGLPM